MIANLLVYFVAILINKKACLQRLIALFRIIAHHKRFVPSSKRHSKVSIISTHKRFVQACLPVCSALSRPVSICPIVDGIISRRKKIVMRLSIRLPFYNVDFNNSVGFIIYIIFKCYCNHI
jgi:hypothetical protein